MDTNYFEALLTSKHLTKYLFPQDRMLISLMPYKPLLQNVHHLFGQDYVMYSDITNTGNREGVGLLTTSSYFPGSTFQCVLNIDVFGTDISTLDSHILAHLTHWKKEVNNGRVLLYLCSEEDMPLQKRVESMFQRHGVTLVKQSKQINRMERLHLLEIDTTNNKALQIYLNQKLNR